MSAPGEFQTSLQSKFRSVVDDKFLIGAVIGVGTYGGVLEALSLENGAQVAIKIAKPEDETIEHEIRVYQILKKSRFTPEMVHFNLKSSLGRILVLSREGKSLHDYWLERRLFPDHNIAGIVVQIVEALQYLHSKKIVHRDVSLGNVLLSPGPEGTRCLLVDFGLSTIRKDSTYDSPFALRGSTPVFQTALYVLRGEEHVEIDDFYQVTYLVLALSRSPLLLKATDLKEWGAVKEGLRFRLRETLPEKHLCFKQFFEDVHFYPRVKASGMGWPVETKHMLMHLKAIDGWNLPIEL